MRHSQIVAIGSALPDQIIKNDELPEHLDTNDEWIRTRSGIEQRYLSSDEETVADYAYRAAEDALRGQDDLKAQIDHIIVATFTPNRMAPSTACMLQTRLDLPGVPAFDINAACSGFLYALSVADNMVKCGQANCVLVVGAEQMSRILNWEDRTTCVLFGDGAGAVVVTASEKPGILSTHLYADGRYSHCLEAGGDIFKDPENHRLVMQGREVFRHSVTMLGQMFSEVLDEHNLKGSDIDWLVPHQANLRIINAMAKQLDLPLERVVTTIKEHANTAAASVPLGMKHLHERQLLKPGQLVMLEVFGAGFTWGAALFEVTPALLPYHSPVVDSL